MLSVETLVLQTDPVANVDQLLEGFGQVVANGDPLSVVLLAVGALVTGVAAVGFGLLAAGGLLSGLGRAITREPPQEA